MPNYRELPHGNQEAEKFDIGVSQLTLILQVGGICVSALTIIQGIQKFRVISVIQKSKSPGTRMFIGFGSSA